MAPEVHQNYRSYVRELRQQQYTYDCETDPTVTTQEFCMVGGYMENLAKTTELSKLMGGCLH